ncbi:adhesion G protein-coupled receptor G3 isoform A [Alligator mississippiensis]|uniref:Adhesion G protein-coupled receptor G3 isoform A n=1 Tax=Alligator mississippiensis TaxID=8496 RepID=A0A151MSN4_ALLMI|nr:adhesion G protein-coupled receptor G3 isoform A [Alligator mississippiensis]
MVNWLHSVNWSLLVTILIFLPLLATPRGDNSESCCLETLPLTDNPQNLKTDKKIIRLSATCDDLWQTNSDPCISLRKQILRYWLHFEDHLITTWYTQDSLDLNWAKTRSQNISATITQAVVFTFVPSEVPTMIDVNGKRNTSSVKLPMEIFQSFNNKTDQVTVAVTTINSGESGLFKEPNQTGTVLDNVVVSVKVKGKRITGLRECIELSYLHKQLPQNLTRQCVFWDFNKGQNGGWNSSGCHAKLHDTETVCCCDHLTFFTLLLNPSIDNITAQSLLTTTNVGCGISMVFLSITVILYFFLRFFYKKFKSDNTVKIHMNLSGSLFILNVAYLLNNGINHLDHPGLCKGLGGFTHYCLLCCFTWMAIEGFHLYLLVIKVVNTYIQYYLVKLCLIGWGFPAIVVTITGSINSYGEYTIMDMANRTTLSLCWINSDHLTVHYVTDFGYFCLVFLFNALVLAIVAWKLFSLQSITAGKGEKTQAWKGGLTVLGLSCLLGATWGLAFFTYGSMSVPALYFFSILNSLQGLFIFIWFVFLYFPKNETPTSSSSNAAKNEQVTNAFHSSHIPNPPPSF